MTTRLESRCWIATLGILLGCGGGGGSGPEGPVPDVSGIYVTDRRVFTSTCDTRVEALVSQTLRNLGECQNEVSQSGSEIEIVNLCDGTIYRGTVDAGGNVRASTSVGAVSEGGCALAAEASLSANALQASTVLTVHIAFDFANDCVFIGTGERVRDCEGTLEARIRHE